MDTILPTNLPTPVVYKEEFEQYRHVAHGFHLSAFEAGLLFPLEAAAHDMAALIEEVNQRASQVVPDQLQKLAEAKGLTSKGSCDPLGRSGRVVQIRAHS